MTTIGEMRVLTDFNPSATSSVDVIKQATAKLIDLCAGLRAEAVDPSRSDSEAARLASLAMTAYEEAAMWAVKAATA